MVYKIYIINKTTIAKDLGLNKIHYPNGVSYMILKMLLHTYIYIKTDII